MKPERSLVSIGRLPSRSTNRLALSPSSPRSCRARRRPRRDPSPAPARRSAARARARGGGSTCASSAIGIDDVFEATIVPLGDDRVDRAPSPASLSRSSSGTASITRSASPITLDVAWSARSARAPPRPRAASSLPPRPRAPATRRSARPRARARRRRRPATITGIPATATASAMPGAHEPGADDGDRLDLGPMSSASDLTASGAAPPRGARAQIHEPVEQLRVRDPAGREQRREHARAA